MLMYTRARKETKACVDIKVIYILYFVTFSAKSNPQIPSDYIRGITFCRWHIKFPFVPFVFSRKVTCRHVLLEVLRVAALGLSDKQLNAAQPRTGKCTASAYGGQHLYFNKQDNNNNHGQ